MGGRRWRDGGRRTKDEGRIGQRWVYDVMDLCLSCKACKTECPSNVDISKLKAEYTAQRYERDGVPFAARVFGHVRRLNALGSRMHAVANFVNAQGGLNALLKSITVRPSESGGDTQA